MSRFIVGPDWYHPGDIVEIPEEYFQSYMMEKVAEPVAAEEPIPEVAEEVEVEEPVESEEILEEPVEPSVEEKPVASTATTAAKVRKRRKS